MPNNGLKAKWTAQEAVLGILAGFPSLALTEIWGRSGFDFVMADREHGSFSIADVTALAVAARAAGVTPLARVMRNEPKEILRVLDAGALGIMVPQIESAQEALAARQAARYAPEGARGSMPLSPAAGYGTEAVAEYVAWANREILVLGQIESVNGWRSLDAILAAKALDAIVIGPADLAQSMGFPGESNRDEVRAAVREIAARCVKAGVPVGTVLSEPEQGAALSELGCSFHLLSGTQLLVQAAQRFVARWRSAAKSR